MTRYSQVQEAKKGGQGDFRRELSELETMLEELKIQFEQYFSGILPMQPDKLHADVRRKLRRLFKMPFKSAALGYRLRTVESRYSTYHSYWQRILKQKEEGTYSKDIFKAEARKRVVQFEEQEATAQGAASKQMKELFSSYKGALEKATNRPQQICFDEFKKSLVKRARAIQEQQGNSRVSFKVVVKDGKVRIAANTQV